MPQCQLHRFLEASYRCLGRLDIHDVGHRSSALTTITPANIKHDLDACNNPDEIRCFVGRLGGARSGRQWLLSGSRSASQQQTRQRSFRCFIRSIRVSVWEVKQALRPWQTLRSSGCDKRINAISYRWLEWLLHRSINCVLFGSKKVSWKGTRQKENFHRQ